MGSRSFQYQAPIPLAKQLAALKASYPEAKGVIKKRNLFWDGKLSPTPLLREYCVHIKYSLEQGLETWVIGDSLQRLDDPDFPHHYEICEKEKMVKICLYLPGTGEWSRNKVIANTIVPWAIEWLFFYEIWLSTGEWRGGGQHPAPGKRKEIEQNREPRAFGY